MIFGIKENIKKMKANDIETNKEICELLKKFIDETEKNIQKYNKAVQEQEYTKKRAMLIIAQLEG